MLATRLTASLILLAIATSPAALSGCAWFMRKAEPQAQVDRTPEPPRADGKLVTTGGQHATWVDLKVRPLGAWNFDAAPFTMVRSDATVSPRESVWTILCENRAGRATNLVFRLADPMLTMGKKFNVMDPRGLPLEPPLATAEIHQAVTPGDASAFRVWVASPRNEAIEVTEVGPASRVMLTVDLVFAAGPKETHAPTGTFGLQGTVTIYSLRPVAGLGRLM